MVLPLKTERVVDVEAGSRHSVFVTASNKVYTCGDANQGQLGLGANLQDRVLTPTLVSTFDGVKMKQVCSGKFHTLFLTE